MSEPAEATNQHGPGGLGDVTTRFSRRVEDYVRYRPGYPDAVLDTLCAWRFLPGIARATVLDVGAGTGLSSEPFLRAGHRVLAVEPNAEMRAAAERGLKPRYPERFQTWDGRAEATTLPGAAVDLVVAGQAFHWFDPAAARAEFARVLRPGGAMAIVWNERLLAGTPFLAAYEHLLVTSATDYAAVTELYPTSAKIGEFFQTPNFRVAEFANFQDFDFEGLLGRLRSSSYAPPPEAPTYGPMQTALRGIFDQHQENGRVRISYRTRLFADQL